MRDPKCCYHFVVVCPRALGVYLLGDFNNWSTTATPLQLTERNVWQLDVVLPAGSRDFSYFVIDDRWSTGRAPFGNTYLLPGSWATVVRSTPVHSTPAPSALAFTQVN